MDIRHFDSRVETSINMLKLYALSKEVSRETVG